MKKLYIPKGEVRHYESVESGNLVVRGTLIVEGSIRARHISGGGIITAGSISAETVEAMDIEAAHIVVETLGAQRVSAAELHVSSLAVVSCHLNAQCVETSKLIVAQSQIGELRAQEVIHLPPKHRSLVGTLVAAFFRSLWADLFCTQAKNDPIDADWRPHGEPPVQPEQEETEAPKADTPLEDDFEFLRLKAMYRISRDHGYTLRLVPEETIKTQQAAFFTDAARPAA